MANKNITFFAASLIDMVEKKSRNKQEDIFLSILYSPIEIIFSGGGALSRIGPKWSTNNI